MKPYEIISHTISDIICACLQTHKYGLLHFNDFLRYDHSWPTNTEYPPFGWLEDKFDCSDYAYQSKWISSAQRLSEHDGHRKAKLANEINFIDHSFEPVLSGLDQILWDDVVRRRTPHVIIHSEYNSKDLDRIDLPNIHWFAHAYICSEFYFRHYQKLQMVTDYTSRPINYPWLCTNRLIRPHRTDFLEMLDLTQGCYSFLNPDPNGVKYTGPVPAQSFDSHQNHSAEIKINDLTPWNTSFLHIVTETVWQEKIHFTEKVFKPIVLHQPFVVLQAPGSLTYLRSYGFKTFGAWWDESYDTIEDPQERMQAIADIVNWIGAQSTDELETMRMEMASVLEHNFRHFYENIPAICLNELSVGLTLTP